MENKYFTPDIEDLYVGYKLEIKGKHDVDWQPVVLGKDAIWHQFTHIESLSQAMEQLRVPYLNKEQIEAEGWENIAVYRDGGTTIFLIKNSKYSYELTFRGRAHLTPSDKITITEIRETPDRPVRVNIFTGECKDINTFRKIIKLLGI